MGKELFNPHLNKFSIRKLNVGVCSVLLSTVFLLGTAATVNADETASGSVDDNISLPEKPTDSAMSQPVSQPALENTADVIRGNEVRICTEGVFELSKDSVVATDLGKGVKIVSANKVDITSAPTDVKIGQIVGIVNESKVLVKIK